jgi:3-oxoacyl-(acyl-carrier-protein) synthase
LSGGQAIADAAIDLGQEDRIRIGMYLGNGNGGYPNIEEAVRTIIARGGMRMDPLFMAKSLPNMAAAQVSLQVQETESYSRPTMARSCSSDTPNEPPLSQSRGR